MARPPSDARDRILDAAEDLVLREGSARLTLDAVAAEARVSKGGLLYHFPSKDDLIRAMVQRLVLLFDLTLTSIMAADANPIGRYSRGFIEQMRAAQSDPTLARADRVSAALVAASAADPRLLDPLRECYRTLQKNLENDGIDPVDATLVRLASDALWMGELFGIPGPDPALKARVLDRLMTMTLRPCPNEASKGSDPTPPSEPTVSKKVSPKKTSKGRKNS